MKKVTSIILTVASGAVTIIGIGTLGGTYGSYNNYQILSNAYNAVSSYASNSSYSSIPTENLPLDISSFGTFVSSYNTLQSAYSKAGAGDLQNEAAKTELENLNNNYSSADDYANKMAQGQAQTQDVMNAFKAQYNYDKIIWTLNWNYNADQSGVIAGAVLLAIGLIAFIVSLVILLKKKKQIQPQPESQPTE